MPLPETGMEIWFFSGADPLVVLVQTMCGYTVDPEKGERIERLLAARYFAFQLVLSSESFNTLCKKFPPIVNHGFRFN